MPKSNYERIEENILNREARQEKKKMRISGKGVFKLQEIIKGRVRDSSKSYGQKRAQ